MVCLNPNKIYLLYNKMKKIKFNVMLIQEQLIPNGGLEELPDSLIAKQISDLLKREKSSRESAEPSARGKVNQISSLRPNFTVVYKLNSELHINTSASLV